MPNRITRIMQGLEANDLLEIIRELPTKYRMVFNLYAIEGYSHKEISKMVNISGGYIKIKSLAGKGYSPEKSWIIYRN
jgi:DNA-directed RNA polymerase specialized sigma24 family protein